MTMRIEGVNVAHQEDGNLRITITGTEGATEVMRSWLADTGDVLSYASFVDSIKASMIRKAYEEGQFIPDSEDEGFKVDE